MPIISLTNKEIKAIVKIEQSTNSSLDCLVLDRNKPSGHDELDNFLHTLSIDPGEDKRYQILYKTYAHWSVMDIRIRDRKAEFFLIDASRSIHWVVFAVQSIRKHFPDAPIRYPCIKFHHTLKNCAVFALDFAFQLAKIPNLHDKAEACETRGAFIDPINVKIYKNLSDFLFTILSQIKEYMIEDVRLSIDELKVLTDSITAVDEVSFMRNFPALLIHTQSLSYLQAYDNLDGEIAPGITLKQHIVKHRGIEDISEKRPEDISASTVVRYQNHSALHRLAEFTTILAKHSKSESELHTSEDQTAAPAAGTISPDF